MENELADLGLGLEDTSSVEGVAAVDAKGVTEADVDGSTEKKTRKAVTLGAVVASEEPEDLPEIEGRGFGGGERGSKYDFSDINAPVSKGVVDGVEKFGYFSKTYNPGEGTEIDALDSSVKSAVSQRNKAAREAGTNERFATRAVLVEGVHVATKVLRVDLTTGLK